ncbi:unconventional myosin [Acrasis kona]|uniref:Unconventional myosin n=1 Tax=Acrasis kona TaxID=1008807 RepID=A0AAW2Z0Y7_9EUKA
MPAKSNNSQASNRRNNDYKNKNNAGFVDSHQCETKNEEESSLNNNVVLSKDELNEQKLTYFDLEIKKKDKTIKDFQSDIEALNNKMKKEQDQSRSERDKLAAHFKRESETFNKNQLESIAIIEELKNNNETLNRDKKKLENENQELKDMNETLKLKVFSIELNPFWMDLFNKNIKKTIEELQGENQELKRIVANINNELNQAALEKNKSKTLLQELQAKSNKDVKELNRKMQRLQQEKRDMEEENDSLEKEISEDKTNHAKHVHKLTEEIKAIKEERDRIVTETKNQMTVRFSEEIKTVKEERDRIVTEMRNQIVRISGTQIREQGGAEGASEIVEQLQELQSDIDGFYSNMVRDKKKDMQIYSMLHSHLTSKIFEIVEKNNKRSTESLCKIILTNGREMKNIVKVVSMEIGRSAKEIHESENYKLDDSDHVELLKICEKAIVLAAKLESHQPRLVYMWSNTPVEFNPEKHSDMYGVIKKRISAKYMKQGIYQPLGNIVHHKALVDLTSNDISWNKKNESRSNRMDVSE